MSTLMELTVVLVVCPALLAAWLDNATPGSGRGEMRRIAIHIGLGGLLAFVVLRPLLLTVGALLDGPAAQVDVVRRRLHRHHLRHRRVAVGDAQRGRAGQDHR